MTANFADTVADLRTSREVSQTDCAWRMGVKPSYLAKIERGAQKPTLRIVEKLTTALELTPEERTLLLDLASLRVAPAPVSKAVAPPLEPFDDRLRFDGMEADAYECRLLAAEMERSLPGNPFSRSVKATVPVEAVGLIRPRFPSLKLAAMWDETYENRFGRRKAA